MIYLISGSSKKNPEFMGRFKVDIQDMNDVTTKKERKFVLIP
jgi:hypothetical protein